MHIVTQICLVTAFFLALKAIEYKPQPNFYPVCSIGAWVAFIVGVITWLIL
jgi:hypothetical protein